MSDIRKANRVQKVIGDAPANGIPDCLRPPRPSREVKTTQTIASTSKAMDAHRSAGIQILQQRNASTRTADNPNDASQPYNAEMFSGMFPPLVKRGRGRPPKPVDPNAPVKPKRKPGRPRKDEQLIPATIEQALNNPEEFKPAPEVPEETKEELRETKQLAPMPPAPSSLKQESERVSWIGSDEETNYDHPFTLSYSDTECRINGVLFRKCPDICYKHDYAEIAKRIVAKELSERDAWRNVVKDDLWFIVYFVLKVAPLSNHKFVVDYAREIEDGPASETLDVVAREHFKSTLITIGESIKDLLNNPEERICLFSYAATAASAFLRSIKYTFESSKFLYKLFPDVLWKDPEKESPRWSENGFQLKRQGNYKECSVEAYGLAQGMPTGGHFSKLVYDDIMVADMAFSPIAMERCKEKFGLSANLGTFDGRSRVVGTYYHYNDPIVYISKMEDGEGHPLYTVRKKPATVDGTYWGAPVFLPPKRLAKLRADKYSFSTQQLLDPSPIGQRKLDSTMLEEVEEKTIPNNLIKIMLVDPAGMHDKAIASRDPDSWAVGVIGISPELHNDGTWDVYILDLMIEQLTLTAALEQVVHIYIRNGYIKKLGVEKVGQSTFELHVANALKARGRRISFESGNICIVTPAGRSKEYRIESALELPLRKRRIKISRKIPAGYRDRLREEMDRFPMWHDDGLDILSYSYDIMKSINFRTDLGSVAGSKNIKSDRMMDYKRVHKHGYKRSWMTAG